MAKLLPFAASGVAPQGVQGSSHGGQSLTPLCRSSGIGSALNLDRWNAHFMGKASCGRRRHVFVTCAGKGGSKKVDGTGKQAVLDKRRKDNVPSVKKESEPVIPDLWSAGASVTALQPREEENLLLASWYARNPGGWKNSKRPDPETVSGSGGVRVSDERARVDVLLRDQDAQDAGVDGEEDGKEEGEVGEDEKEEWVEIEDEEWDKRLAEGDEDLELVEVWEGDLGPMTAEEEAALLLEAEQEIAELEREQAEKERRASSAAASPSKQSPGQGASGKQNVTEMEKELAMLQELVGNLQEQIAKEKSEGSEGSSSGTGPSAPPDNGEEDQNSLEVPTKTSASKFFEMYKWDKDQGIVRRKGKERDISPDAPTNETVSRFNLEGSEDDGSSEDISEHMTTEATSSRSEKRRIIAEPHEYEEDEDVDDLDKDKRGIPAVMRCFDRAKIYAKAGDGGDGVVAFRREKFVPFGGPSGGNGGDGGDVYIEADPGINSLLPFRRTIHFRATRGSHGQGKAKTGATGEHCIVKVPVGTLVKDSEGNGDILLDLSRPGQRELLLPGGRGGRGNGAFKSGRNKAPQIAENGEEGAEMWVELELKLVADVGIIGVPNAGKSTLLSSISAARPEIANYPFTTLLPNLGVVALGFDASMVVADLPGLLEGAHTGYGLGHEFLRHTERCRVLIHVVDGMSQQAEYEYEAVRLELQLFNPELQHKPFLVAYNKMDIPEAADRWENFQRFLRSKGVEPLCMSAATQQGTKEVVDAAYELLKQSAQPLEADADVEVKGPSVGEIVKQKRSAPIEDFSITCDKHTRTWYIDGAGLKRFTQMTNWEYFEAVRRFQHVLNASGVSKALREQGVQEGDTVIVGQMEFNWVDKDDFRSLGEWKRGIRGSKVWPH